MAALTISSSEVLAGPPRDMLDRDIMMLVNFSWLKKKSQNHSLDNSGFSWVEFVGHPVDSIVHSSAINFTLSEHLSFC